MKKTLSIMIAVLMLVCSALYANAEDTSSDTSAPASCVSDTKEIIVTDTHGREVRLNAPAKRIIAIAPSDCDILQSLGAEKQVIAVGNDCEWPDTGHELPRVATYMDIDAKQLISLKPDLVILYQMSGADKIAQELGNAGIPTVITKADSMSEVYDMIRLLGRLTGKDTEAEYIIKYMTEMFDLIVKARPMTGKTVYFEVSPLSYGLFTAGKNTYLNDLADICGYTNIFADIEGWPSVSQEQVIERDPDYIVSLMYSENGSEVVEEIKNRPGWEKIKAVKDGNISCMESGDLSRPATHLVEFAYYLYLLLYPESPLPGMTEDAFRALKTGAIHDTNAVPETTDKSDTAGSSAAS